MRNAKARSFFGEGGAHAMVLGCRIPLLVWETSALSEFTSTGAEFLDKEYVQ
jgi:hypothetical protein